MGTVEGAEGEVRGMTPRHMSVDRIVVAENTARYGLHDIIEGLDFIWKQIISSRQILSPHLLRLTHGVARVMSVVCRLARTSIPGDGRRAAEWHPSLP
jgi:hypothetical protein